MVTKERKMTLLYLVERSDEWDYDEFDAFVVRAESKEHAQEIAYEASDSRPEGRNRGFLSGSVKQIPVLGKAEVILGSFRAG